MRLTAALAHPRLTRRLASPTQDVRNMLDKHYSVERCIELKKYNEFPSDCVTSAVKKEAFMRGTTTGRQDVFNVSSVTLAIGRQLLLERYD